ncbi:MAG: adenine-specific methyltransferase EcoRI family protein, partial [Oscillospiraceae bacterium]|nr:adenine-specific methyltransferase EcoRI family protein [Oscillospiraceae bacterium]
EYLKYNNYDAIEVLQTANIPNDYYEAMGVPITFMTKHKPNQFDILGIDKDVTLGGTRFILTVNGKPKIQYARLVIRRKREDTSEDSPP